MKVTAIKRFKDKNNGVIHNKGDAFIVSAERYKELINSRHGALVEAVAEETAKPKKRAVTK